MNDDFLSRINEITKHSESRGKRYDKQGRLLTSPVGALGENQVMPKTATDPGFGIKPAGKLANGSWDPNELARVGKEYLPAMLARYGNDPAKMWGAYNWGPGRMDKALKDHGDKWLDFAPEETKSYVAKNMKMLGGEQIPQAPSKAPTAPATGMLGSVDEFMQAGTLRVHSTREQAPLGQPPKGWGKGAPWGWDTPGAGTALREAEIADTNKETMAAAEQVAKEQAVGFADRVKSVWNHDSIPSDIRKFQDEKDHKPSLGFDPRKANPGAYLGQDSEAYADYDQAVNAEDLAERVAERATMREHYKTVYGQGFWKGIGAEMVASLPTDGAIGLIASGGMWTLGKGAYKFAKAGQKTAALASAYAENVVANVGVTATRDLLGTDQSLSQYAVDLGISLVGPAAEARAIGRLADAATFERTQARIMADKVADLEQLQTRARATLPDNATTEEIEVAMARIKVEDLTAQVKPQGARKILAEVDEAADEAPVPRQAADTRTMSFTKEDPDATSIPREELATMPAGVYKAPGLDLSLTPAFDVVSKLAARVLPGMRIAVGTIQGKAEGAVKSWGDTSQILLRVQPTDRAATIRTAVHEVGHVVTDVYLRNAPTGMQARIDTAWAKVRNDLLDKNIEGTQARLAPDQWGGTPLNITNYTVDKGEWLAEQFVKYVQEDAMKGGGKVPLAKFHLQALKDYVKKAWDLFVGAKEEKYLTADESVVEFFDAVFAGRITPGQAIPTTQYSLAPDLTPSGLSTATKYGLDLMPVNTPLERAKQKQMVALYEQADAWAVANPMDAEWEKRVATLNNNRLFNVASTSANMLMSRNPVVRMVAAELLESPSGAAGRRPTAALRKHLAEGRLMGNTINDFQATFNQWRREEGVGIWASTMEPQAWYNFNRAVSLEIEGRAAGSPPSNSAAIRTAADVMEAAYERARVMQVEARTTGWASLPETSVGYMPHRMSPTAIRNLSNEQARTLHGVLSEQFQSIEGWDVDFSNRLADKYLDRVQKRALGDYDAAVGVHQTGAMDAVEEALQDMGMTDVEVRAMMTRYMNNAAGHTKRRIKLDLTREYGEGSAAFRLADVFETDHIKLLRSQAHRVSGEVALADNGIMGLGGLKIIRQAMQYGETGAKAEASAIEAFDQVSAEFMGQPFGNHLGKWGERAMIANSLARLNGMGFTQLAETVNGVTSVGFFRTLASMGNMRRLNQEINALARGEAVDNPILGSVESWGREFGTDNYKLVFPFDNPEHAYNSVGMVDPSTTDRLLRMASHAQGKVTLFRAIHGVQQRGMAEQIIRKASDYLRTGSNDAALRDMGFDDAMMTALRADLPNIARYDGDKLVEFNINNATNREAAEAFVHAVHRGAAQIIQGAFIGETGAWAHSGWLKILTQFRTFSIIAVEKQWGRNRNNLGIAKAGGILLGSMIMVAPIAMARAYAASVGRADQEEYLEKRLAPGAIARASLNMVANSGYLPDLMDALTAATGTGDMTGGRAGSESQAVGNLLAPSAGLIDDAWAGLQNTRDGTDPTKLLKTLPFGNHPLLTPFINSMAQ